MKIILRNDQTGGKTTKVGKTKTKTSVRTIPLNQNAIDAIIELRKEYYFGEDITGY